jgi:hypothetical protein
MKQTVSPLVAVIAILVSSTMALATEEVAAPTDDDKLAPPEAKRELSPEQQAEKEAHKACEAKICDIIATRDPAGADVTCDIVKTWREADLVKMLGGRINWPWGGAMCQSKVTLERGPLAKAMREPAYEMSMPTQTARCTLAQKEDGDPYVVEISVAPKVKFENGKAVEGQVNWGTASAPMAIHPLIYAGTALDNSTNVLGPELVRLVNAFTAKKCAQVKAELPGSTPD